MNNKLNINIQIEIDLGDLMQRVSTLDKTEENTAQGVEAKYLNSQEESILRNEKILKSWKDIKEYVKQDTEMTVLTYKTWLEPLEIVGIKDDVVYVKSPYPGADDYIKAKFFIQLTGATLDLVNERVFFEFVS